MYITDISKNELTILNLIEKVLNGEEVILSTSGQPVVKMIPFEMNTEPRKLGAGNWKGEIWIADDFDDESDEINEMFYGSDDDELFT